MNRIKQLRTERGWTQEELGEKLNVKRAAISKYESGRIPLTDDTIYPLLCYPWHEAAAQPPRLR